MTLNEAIRIVRKAVGDGEHFTIRAEYNTRRNDHRFSISCERSYLSFIGNSLDEALASFLKSNPIPEEQTPPSSDQAEAFFAEAQSKGSK